MRITTVTRGVETTDGWDEEAIALPLRWCICGQCRGEGTSSAYLGAFSRDDFAEDPEFAEGYMSGDYDRTCNECGGSGKVQEIDEAKMTPELWSLYEEAAQADAYDRGLADAERRMGA